jgi:DNA polymerase elongation subunit (family B)
MHASNSDSGYSYVPTQNVFTLKGCLPIVGAQVISSETEEEMLLKWRSFLHACDADILTGYNVQVRLMSSFNDSC